MTGKNTYCTAFYIFSSSRSAQYLYMEAASCHRSSSNYSNNKQRLVTPGFSRCMLIVGFRFQPPLANSFLYLILVSQLAKTFA